MYSYFYINTYVLRGNIVRCIHTIRLVFMTLHVILESTKFTIDFVTYITNKCRGTITSIMNMMRYF